MKKLILITTLLFSSITFAESMTLEIDVPKGAKEMTVIAKNVEVDTCNSFGLRVVEGFGAVAGYRLYVTGTELACPFDEVKEVTLKSTVELLERRSSVKFKYHSGLSDLKIKFTK